MTDWAKIANLAGALREELADVHAYELPPFLDRDMADDKEMIDTFLGELEILAQHEMGC